MAGAWNVIEKVYWSSQLGPSLDIAIELNRWKPPPIVSPLPNSTTVGLKFILL